jgi:putative ABC transport system permease protein
VNIRCRETCPSIALVRQRLIATYLGVTVVDADRLEDVYFEKLAQPRATAALGFTIAAIARLRRRPVQRTKLLGRPPRARIRHSHSAWRIARSNSALVLRDGLVVAVMGVGVGTLAGWFLARTMGSLHYGVTTSDPLSLMIVLGLLGMTTLSASRRPAQAACAQ